MRFLTRCLLVSTVSLASVSAYAADTYTLDPMHTNVFWHANHMGFSTPSGKFADVKGTVTLDEAAPQNSALQVTIASASIVTGIEKFDTHLKSKDFFNVEQFPTATFVSTKVEPTGTNTAKVTGTLTMLGVAKPVTLDVKLNKIGENPMTKAKTAGFSATGTIKRSEFGMNYGVPMVADDVQLTIESEATIAAK